MGKLSTTAKKAILISAGLVVLLCAFFFIFQRNQDTVTQIENQTRQFRNRVNYLSQLQIKVNELQETSEKHQKAVDTYTKEFPCMMTQQKAIYNVYLMMVKSGVRVTAIKPGEAIDFLKEGKIISAEEQQNQVSNTSETEAASPSGIEASPEEQTTVDHMVGKYSSYEIEMTGTMKQIMKALDWVSDNKEHMAVTNTNLNYDVKTGKLTGTININYFELNGNGKPYKEPDVKGISIGTDSIFGVLKN